MKVYAEGLLFQAGFTASCESFEALHTPKRTRKVQARNM